MTLTTTSSTYLAVNGGSVGVGTSSPQAKLDVNGASLLRSGVTIGGGSPQAGYVLTAQDGKGTAAWKQPAAQVPSGTWCGQAETRGGVLTIDSTYIACQGGYPVINAMTGTPIDGDPGHTSNCPSGYTGMMIYGADSNWLYSCIKN